MLNAITNSGRKVKFSKEELREMHAEIANMSEVELESTYYQADNLPKWLWTSGICKRSKKSIVVKLLKFITAKEEITIDVRTKK